jgi:hypothetical protein
MFNFTKRNFQFSDYLMGTVGDHLIFGLICYVFIAENIFCKESVRLRYVTGYIITLTFAVVLVLRECRVSLTSVWPDRIASDVTYLRTTQPSFASCCLYYSPLAAESATRSYFVRIHEKTNFIRRMTHVTPSVLSTGLWDNNVRTSVSVSKHIQ